MRKTDTPDTLHHAQTTAPICTDSAALILFIGTSKKTKRITLERKGYTKDARIARYPAPDDTLRSDGPNWVRMRL